MKKNLQILPLIVLLLLGTGLAIFVNQVNNVLDTKLQAASSKKHYIDLSIVGPVEQIESNVNGFSSSKKYQISRNRPGLIYITMSAGLDECVSNLDLELKGNSEPSQVGLSYAKKYEELNPGVYYIKCRMFNNGSFNNDDTGKYIEAKVDLSYDNKPEITGEYKFDVMVVDDKGNPREGAPIEIMGVDNKFYPGYRYDSDGKTKSYSDNQNSYFVANIYVDDNHPNLDSPEITDEQKWLKEGEGYYWQVCAKDNQSDCISEKDGVISKGTIQQWGGSGQLIAWSPISKYDIVKLTIVRDVNNYYLAYKKVNDKNPTSSFNESLFWRDPLVFSVESGAAGLYTIGQYGQSGTEYVINLPYPEFNLKWNKYKYDNLIYFLKDKKDGSITRIAESGSIGGTLADGDSREFEIFNLQSSFHLLYSLDPLASLSGKKIIIKYSSSSCIAANQTKTDDKSCCAGLIVKDGKCVKDDNEEDDDKVSFKLIGNIRDSAGKEKIADVGSNVKMTIECSDGKVRKLNTKDGYFIYNINNLPVSGCKLINNTDALMRDNWSVADYKYKGYSLCKDSEIGSTTVSCATNIISKNSWDMSTINDDSKYQIVYYYDKLDVENEPVNSDLEDKIDQLILMIKKILEKLGIGLE